MKLSELSHLYCNFMELQGLSFETIRPRRYLLGAFVREVGDMEAEEVRQYHIESYLIRRKRDGDSAGHLRIIHIVLSNMFQYAVRVGILSSNPVNGIPREKAPRRFPRPLPKGVPEQILQATAKENARKVIRMKDARARAITLCGLLAGLRTNEVRTLLVKDVDFSTMMLTVRRGKGNKARRVPIHPVLAEALYEYQLLRLEFDPGPDGEKPLFVFKNRGKYKMGQPNSIRRAYFRWANLIGLPAGTFHQLRHTFATQMVRNRENLRTIQVLLGHADIQTTQIYTGVDEETMEEAVKRLW